MYVNIKYKFIYACSHFLYRNIQCLLLNTGDISLSPPSGGFTAQDIDLKHFVNKVSFEICKLIKCLICVSGCSSLVVVNWRSSFRTSQQDAARRCRSAPVRETFCVCPNVYGLSFSRSTLTKEVTPTNKEQITKTLCICIITWSWIQK